MTLYHCPSLLPAIRSTQGDAGIGRGRGVKSRVIYTVWKEKRVYCQDVRESSALFVSLIRYGIFVRLSKRLLKCCALSFRLTGSPFEDWQNHAAQRTQRKLLASLCCCLNQTLRANSIQILYQIACRSRCCWKCPSLLRTLVRSGDTYLDI